MADIELIIKIPKELYESYKGRPPMLGDVGIDMITQSIANGTPLPKEHGRLLDEKDILDIENNDGGLYDLVAMPEYLAGVKAVIEADKKNEE